MLNNKKIQCVGINSAGIVIVRDESITLNKFAPDVVSLLDSKVTKMELQTGLGTKADKSYNSGFIGGSGARLYGAGGAAIGYNAQASLGGAAGNTSKADEGGAVGYGANTNHGGAVGKDAQSMHGGAVGRNAVTRLGAAIGDGAQTVDEDGNPITAIQLGGGTNTEPNTAKFFDYTIMNADGSIPPERLNGDFYTKDETDTKIAEAQSIIPVRHIVDELPTENINTRDTYLVPAEDPNDNNVYTEYMYIDGEWEVIGSPFEVDLSGYYTKTEIDGKLETEEGGFQAGNGASADLGGAVGSGASAVSGGAVGNGASVDSGGAVGKNAGATSGGAVGYGASATRGGAVGEAASSNGDGGAIGYNTGCSDGGSAGNTANTVDGAAVGKGASSMNGGAIGEFSMCNDGGAVGSGAKTGDGFAGGKNAKATNSIGTGIDAIQLGTGTNTVEKTLQIYNYRLMDADGTVPSGRLSNYYTKANVDTKLDEKLDKDTTIVTADSSSDLFSLLQDMSDFNSNDKSTLLLNMNDTMHNVAEAQNDIGDLQTDMADKIGKNDEISVEISSGLETGDSSDDDGGVADLPGQTVAVVSTVWGALESGLRADELLSSKADKSDVYTKTQIDTKLGDKSDKPDITDYLESGENLSVTMTDNNIATCPEVSTLSITMPTSYDVTYCSELSFSSGATPTALTYPESVVMIGMDCIDNVFAPVANKRYTLMTAYNGQSFVGYVSGYEVTA